MSEQEGAPEVGAEIAQIEGLMSSNPAEYWSGDMPDRYRSLIEARQSGEPAPDRGISPAAEVRSIERLMRSEPQRYWTDPAVQARYRDLLAVQAGQEEAAPAPVEAEPWSLPTLGEAISEAAAEGYEIDADVFMARREEASRFLVGLKPADQIELRDAFDALGDVGIVALDALASTGEVHGRASPAEVEEFAAADPIGQRLVERWRDDAPARVGAFHDRIARVLVGLGEAEQDRLLDFVWDLPAKAKVAVFGTLAR